MFRNPLYLVTLVLLAVWNHAQAMSRRGFAVPPSMQHSRMYGSTRTFHRRNQIDQRSGGLDFLEPDVDDETAVQQCSVKVRHTRCGVLLVSSRSKVSPLSGMHHLTIVSA